MLFCLKTQRAIDIGCAVGRSTFELARHFNEVVGVDYSKSFVETCNVLREKGKLGYTVLKQGTITEDHVAVVGQDIVSDFSIFKFSQVDTGDSLAICSLFFWLSLALSSW